MIDDPRQILVTDIGSQPHSEPDLHWQLPSTANVSYLLPPSQHGTGGLCAPAGVYVPDVTLPAGDRRSLDIASERSADPRSKPLRRDPTAVPDVTAHRRSRPSAVRRRPRPGRPPSEHSLGGRQRSRPARCPAGTESRQLISGEK